MTELIAYDSSGLPAHEGGVVEHDWAIVRQRVLDGEPAPEVPVWWPEYVDRPCARPSCKHLAPSYGKHCPIHAAKGEYDS